MSMKEELWKLLYARALKLQKTIDPDNEEEWPKAKKIAEMALVVAEETFETDSPELGQSSLLVTSFGAVRINPVDESVKAAAKPAEPVNSPSPATPTPVVAKAAQPTPATENDAEAWYNKGIALYGLGKYSQANECFDEAVRINPNNNEVWNWKGHTLHRLGKYSQAIECYDRALSINSEFLLKDEAWAGKGDALCKLGSYSEAIECYDKALSVYSIFSIENDVWESKGDALCKLGRYSEAIECYDQALRYGKYLDDNVVWNSEKVWESKGDALCKLGRYSEAIKCFDEAVRINPKLAEAWYKKGIALDNLGKHSQAIECYDEALRINPNIDNVDNKNEDYDFSDPMDWEG